MSLYLLFLVDLQRAEDWVWGGRVCRERSRLSKPQEDALREDFLLAVSTCEIWGGSLLGVLGKPLPAKSGGRIITSRKRGCSCQKKGKQCGADNMTCVYCS